VLMTGFRPSCRKVRGAAFVIYRPNRTFKLGAAKVRMEPNLIALKATCSLDFKISGSFFAHPQELDKNISNRRV
jgi:hypothetical protein